MAKKTRIIMLSIGLLVVLSLIGVSAIAMFSDNDTVTQVGVNGTVDVVQKNFQLKDVSIASGGTGVWGEKISNWNPGDVNMLQWEVENKGNKSVETRNTLYLYWDVSTANEIREIGTIYIYPAYMSDDDIRADMNKAVPTRFIDVGNDNNLIKTSDGQDRYGYKWVVNGDRLAGVGTGAENTAGDSKEVNYQSPDDDTLTTLDHVSYKLAFSPNVTANLMGKSFVVKVVTEAIQSRNTVGFSENVTIIG